MADYEQMYQILKEAAEEELPILRCIPKAYSYAVTLERVLRRSGTLETRYATLCGAMSDGMDEIREIPLANKSAKHLQSALEAAENIYMESV